VGKVERIKSGKCSRVSLTVNPEMRVDEKGLAHGDFAFELADYATMVAVNDPYVVLLSFQVRFLKPVIMGERLMAQIHSHFHRPKVPGKMNPFSDIFTLIIKLEK
jgi:acyl-coenzyme A thioesterase PaaI-like protein